MFLTVTPNAVLDLLIFIPQFQPGVSVHASRVVRSVGGKALDASVALHHLGQQSLAQCCLAGRTGQTLRELLAGYPLIHPQVVGVDGETRTAHILVESNLGRHTHIFGGGLQLTPTHRDQLLAQFTALLPQASFVLTGGALPPGLAPDFFHTLAASAAAHNIPLLVDSFGPPMLACLPAHPALVKLNRDEFARTFGEPPSGMEGLVQAARSIRQAHAIPALVITCGVDGLLAFTPQGEFHAWAPPQVVVNAAGAGDAASAALAWRLAKGDTWPSALVWAAAASAASVLTEGTSDLRLEDALGILSAVECQKIH